MTKDHPRMRRFWWILFSIIGALWTLYGAFAMVIGLIADPVVRWAMLGALVVCGLFFAALAWKPSHDFAIRHSILMVAMAALMIGGGFYCLLRGRPAPAVTGAGIFLMVGGTMALTMPRLLRRERLS